MSSGKPKNISDAHRNCQRQVDNKGCSLVQLGLEGERALMLVNHHPPSNCQPLAGALADLPRVKLQLVDLAKSFAAMIDQHLHARITALHMLAESPLLDDASRWKELYREAQGFHQGFGSHVILAELELFNRAVVGRELRMIEMKEEIDALCRRLGEPPRYRQ